MYRIQGDGDWGDRMERAFFNAGPAPIARDFKTMCYYQSPNRIAAATLPCEHPQRARRRVAAVHQLGCPDVLCCVGACNRILPYYIMHMWMATARQRAGGHALWPLRPSRPWPGQRVPMRLTTTTDYPFGETIRIAVDPERDVEFPLYLRIPAWCRPAADRGQRRRRAGDADDKGFVKIAREWSKGDVVELRFPMAPRVERGFETEFPAANRQYYKPEPDCGLPAAAVALRERCLRPAVVRPADPRHRSRTRRRRMPSGSTPWTPAAGAARTSRSSARPMPAHWDWPLDAPVVVDRAGPGVRLEAERRPGVARRAGGGHGLRNDPPGALRLHEVPHFDVSRDAERWRKRRHNGV